MPRVKDVRLLKEVAHLGGYNSPGKNHLPG